MFIFSFPVKIHAPLHWLTVALMFPKHLWPCNQKFILTFKHFIPQFILFLLWLFLCPYCTFAVSCLASMLHVVYCVLIALTEQKALQSALLFSMWPTDTFGLCWIGLFVLLPHCSLTALTLSVGAKIWSGRLIYEWVLFTFFTMCYS